MSYLFGPSRFQSTVEREADLTDTGWMGEENGISPEPSVVYKSGTALHGYDRSDTVRHRGTRNRRGSYQENLQFSGLRESRRSTVNRISNISRISRDSRVMGTHDGGTRRPSLLGGTDVAVASRATTGANFTTGISLQVQQWKTIHEFENDEQQKYLVFSSLKLNSMRIWHLTMLSVILMFLDIELGIYATKTTNYMIEHFVPPNCWYGVLGDTDKKRFMEFTTRLFLRQNDTSLPNHAITPGQLHVIENEVYFGRLEGQSNGLLSTMTTLWTRNRLKHTFHPNHEKDNDTLRNHTFMPIVGSYMQKTSLCHMLMIIKLLMTFTTFTTLVYLYLYYNDVRLLHINKKRLPESTSLFQSTMALRPFLLDSLITLPHVPPIATWAPMVADVTTRYPFQLLVLMRLYHFVKKMREHHPMRYNRMTEILCTLSSVKLRAKFLLKAPFMNTPLKAILAIYVVTIAVCTYSIYVLERSSGYCLTLVNSLWVVVVTTTNLGYGDIMVSNAISKILLQMTSIVGVIEMALLVNYVSSALVLPADERRIIGFFEKHRTLQLQRIAAANLIKSRWRLYRAKCKVNECFANQLNMMNESGRGASISESATSRGPRVDFEKILKMHMHHARLYEIDYQHYYHHWLKIKSQAAVIHHNLAKGFTQEDTAIQATYISRKLEDLEQLISAHSKERNQFRARESISVTPGTPKTKSVFTTGHNTPVRKKRPRAATDTERGESPGGEPKVAGSIHDLKKETIKRRWKRIVRHGIPEDKQESSWASSSNPFEALARQSKAIHRRTKLQGMLNAGGSCEDIQVEQLLEEEEDRLRTEKQHETAERAMSVQNRTIQRIERLEDMMGDIARSLSMLTRQLNTPNQSVPEISTEKLASPERSAEPRGEFVVPTTFVGRVETVQSFSSDSVEQTYSTQVKSPDSE